MKILFIVPGSGDSFYCGNCFRDNLQATALRKAGHEVIIMPLYLPLRHRTFQADTPLFFPATTFYAAQKLFPGRHMPNWLKRITASEGLLNMASSLSGSTSAEGMEQMTLAMITGEDTAFQDMVKQLIDWIKEREHPDVIHLSSSLLIAIAKEIKQQVDLRPTAILVRTAPRAHVRSDTADTKRNANLLNMQQTDPLERQSCPYDMTLRIKFFQPIVFRSSLNCRSEAKIEQREVVHELKERILANLAKSQIFADKAALFQFFKILRQRTIVIQPCSFGNCGSRHAHLACSQRANDALIRLRHPEERLVQLLIFSAQSPVLRKEQSVDVLRDTQALFKQAPVIGHSAKYHIALCDLMPVKRESLLCRKLLALGQCKRFKPNPLRNAIVEPAF